MKNQVQNEENNGGERVEKRLRIKGWKAHPSVIFICVLFAAIILWDVGERMNFGPWKKWRINTKSGNTYVLAKKNIKGKRVFDIYKDEKTFFKQPDGRVSYVQEIAASLIILGDLGFDCPRLWALARDGEPSNPKLREFIFVLENFAKRELRKPPERILASLRFKMGLGVKNIDSVFYFPEDNWICVFYLEKEGSSKSFTSSSFEFSNEDFAKKRKYFKKKGFQFTNDEGEAWGRLQPVVIGRTKNSVGAKRT